MRGAAPRQPYTFTYFQNDFVHRNDRRHKILYLAVHDPHTPLSGAGVRSNAFVRYLSEHFTLDLVHMEGSGQAPLPHNEGKVHTLPLVRRKAIIPFSKRGYFIFSGPFLTAARHYLSTERYDAMVCDYGLCGAYGLILKREFNVPVIYSSHNVEYLGYLDKALQDFRRLPLAGWVYAVEKAIAAQADIVVSITEDEKAHYRRWRPEKSIIVIPQGIDEQVFHPNYEPVMNERKTILFCGNFTVPFNRDVIRMVREKILPEVRKACPDVLFSFIGAAPPPIQDPNMKFHGFVKDYPAHLKAADVVISPMLRGHGFPTKIIEALACGKPTVATPVGARGVPRTFGNLYVRPVEGFGETILQILNNGRAVDDDHCAEIRDQFGWDALVGKLHDELNVLWGRSPALQVVNQRS